MLGSASEKVLSSYVDLVAHAIASSLATNFRGLTLSKDFKKPRTQASVWKSLTRLLVTFAMSSISCFSQLFFLLKPCWYLNKFVLISKSHKMTCHYVVEDFARHVCQADWSLGSCYVFFASLLKTGRKQMVWLEYLPFLAVSWDWYCLDRQPCVFSVPSGRQPR